VALERQSIERKDFPVARRGYDPHAVDAHLSALADEIEELKRAARAGPDTLASAVGEQIRAIVAAAETGAAEIRRQAEAQAREIREDASAAARATREQASTNAHEHVGRVSESTAGLLESLDAMERELAAMIGSLRTGTARLRADLESLERNLGELHDAVAPRLAPQPQATVAEAQTPERRRFSEQTEVAADSVGPPDHDRVPVDHDRVSADNHDRVPADHDQRPDEPEVPAAAVLDAGELSDDSDGARLVALNMALGGASRVDTDRYLAENFRLADRHRILDDVYATVER